MRDQSFSLPLFDGVAEPGPVAARTCGLAIRATRLCVSRQRKTPASHSAYSHAGSADVATMANEEHLAILQQGVDAWNAWRGKESSRLKLDVSGMGLRVEDLRGADEAEMNHFIRTILGVSTFLWANLSEANLIGANLSKANLSEANLCEAILEGANLSSASLCEAILEGGTSARRTSTGRTSARRTSSGRTSARRTSCKPISSMLALMVPT
jgi:hypothetical protein